MLTPAEKAKISEVLSVGTVSHSTQIYGGSINDVFKVTTKNGTLLLKRNESHPFPEMFRKEAEGLQQLSAACSLAKIPKVYGYFETDTHQYLALEYLDEQPSTPQSHYRLGEALAELHLTTHNQFGNSYNNYMGALPQENTPTSSWTHFWWKNRIEPQVNLAIENERLSKQWKIRLFHLFHENESLFTSEKPRLLHGDLWSGNFFITKSETPVLFDPAVYFGHREVDIAMTFLFGGFSSEFYEAYQHHSPLESGWQNRLYLFNMYPILVHINLFGSSYLPQLESAYARFV